jgi:hypothetical protein
MIQTFSLRKLKTHPKLSGYYNLCMGFITYLRDKKNIKIFIEGYDDKEADLTFFEKPYMHRWKPEYMKARLAKLYLLETWSKNQAMPLSMLTFTTYHDSDYARRENGQGYTIDQSWDILKTGFRRASMLIRNKIRKGVSYFWIVEPQAESGYPHIHAGFFTEFTEAEKDRLKAHWSQVVKAGDYDHGLDFSFDQSYQNGDISSMRNYLMKYMGKTFVEGIPNWTPEELVFNSIAWKKGFRFFGCSNDLSLAMKRPMKENTSFTCFRTSMTGFNLTHDIDEVLWKNPSVIYTLPTVYLLEEGEWS